MKKILLFALSCFILSCGDQDTTDIGTSTYEVDPVFEPYVQAFIAEGTKRGKTIDFSDTGLRVEFSELALEYANGFCYLGEHHIVINKEDWYSFSEPFRYYLLFHELGHCELNRRHINNQFEDGEWKSIMKGDPFTGIQNRIPTPYFGFRRDYYIDELFNPNTPAPDWSKRQFPYNAPLERTNLIKTTAQNKLNERPTTIPDNYEFEASFNLLTTNNTRTKLEWGTTNYSYYLYIIPDWGYYIGVQLNGTDNNLHYSTNVLLVNGKPIEKVTVRRKDGVEQLFMNDVFAFHLDTLPNLQFIKLDAIAENGQLATSFEVKSFEFNELK